MKKFKLKEEYSYINSQVALRLFDKNGNRIETGFGRNKKERKQDLIKELKEKQEYTNSVFREYYKFLGVK